MSAYNPLTPAIIARLSQIAGKEHVVTGTAIPPQYGYDAGTIAGLPHMPAVLITPATSQEVAAILQLANAALVPVTPRGGGTGLAGGAVPLYGGILLDLQRMDRIIHIDPEARYLIAEPAARTLDIQQAASRCGLLYAGDPCSSDDCVIGGNIATNAGGNRAVKYGVTADQVYEVELATAQGEIVTLGGRLKKNATGYCLVRLIAGSEGTLGVITKATLKLQPLPPIIANYLIVFPSLTAAVKAVNPLLAIAADLVSLELIDCQTMLAIERYQQQSLFPGPAGDCLLLQLEARFDAELQFAICQINQALSGTEHSLHSVDGDLLWQGRRVWGKALQVDHPVSISEDIVVPVDAVAAFVDQLYAATAAFGFAFFIAGHAGDGNMHLRVIPGAAPPALWQSSTDAFRQQLYATAYQLGGRLSGEHGIGLKRKPYLPQYIDPVELALMKQIKKSFDPNNILNPGKIFDVSD